MFFLLNHGHGYTDTGVKDMTIDEMEWHARTLSEKLKAESTARMEAAQRAQQQASRWKLGKR